MLFIAALITLLLFSREIANKVMHFHAIAYFFTLSSRVNKKSFFATGKGRSVIDGAKLRNIVMGFSFTCCFS